jgi:hypothetical protein
VTMVVGLSKRHQFRNEKALYDLIRTIPGNDRCADCQMMNPGGFLFRYNEFYRSNGFSSRMGKLERTCTTPTRSLE